MRAPLGCLEEVLERDVDEREPGFCEELVAIPELAAHEDAPTTLLLDGRSHRELPVDRDRPPVAEEHAPGHGREAVPGGREPAGFVDQRRDHPAVHEPRPALVALVERKCRLVPLGALDLGLRKMEADRVVPAPETRGIVVRRDLQRMPPRSKCALKKFSEPDVAIADEAEISSARVAAATICAKR